MKTIRLQYLDEIKGFAILLMVFAHTIAWSFEDWRTVMYPDVFAPNVINAGLIWRFVYSFHMALFFLVSGYLTYKPQLSKVEGALSSIKKKTIRLLIPYFVTGGLVTIIRPGFGYWFLFSLWELSIIGILCFFVLDRINKRNRLWIDVVFWVMSYLIIKKIFGLFSLENPVADIKYGLTFLPPFIVGIILRKHPKVGDLLSKNYTLLFISFMMCFLSSYSSLLSVNNSFCILILSYFIKIVEYTHATEILGSLTFFLLFKQGVNAKLGNVLSYLGKHTFEIYVIHIFFVVRISQVGAFWLETNLPTCLATQIVYSTCATAIAIVISLIISRFIKHSKVLSQLLFGQ